MRVFVTGASGFIGSAIVRELVGARHEVLGLARSDASAASIEAAGAQVHRGDLTDLASLRDGAKSADAVIHTAFENVSATSDVAASLLANRRAIEAMGEELAGSGRPLAFASGTAGIRPGQFVTEDDVPDDRSVTLFGDAESAALALSAQGVRVAALRLPLSVHGDTDKRGFIPTLVGIAREIGTSSYVDDGANRWPAVHVRDAAALFRLAVEPIPLAGARPTAAAARLHAVADEAVPMRAIAEAIGRGLNLPVTSIPAAEAEAHFGWFAPFAGLDSPATSAHTRTRLNWTPEHPGLLPDLAATHYFTR